MPTLFANRREKPSELSAAGLQDEKGIEFLRVTPGKCCEGKENDGDARKWEGKRRKKRG